MRATLCHHIEHSVASWCHWLHVLVCHFVYPLCV
jgi:hypothetical protein